jgi:hypothetical protein
MDDAVLDFEMPDPPDEEIEKLSEQHKVVSEDDLVGKKANITYNDNLYALAMYLRIPTEKCNHRDKLSGPCPGAQPFRVTLKPRGTGVVMEWVRLLCERLTSSMLVGPILISHLKTVWGRWSLGVS